MKKIDDGTTKEISAAEFAKQAGKLTEQGAEFDFSNFETIRIGVCYDEIRKIFSKFDVDLRADTE